MRYMHVSKLGLCLLAGLVGNVVNAHSAEFHSRRAGIYCRIPPFSYGNDVPRKSIRVISEPTVGGPVKLAQGLATTKRRLFTKQQTPGSILTSETTTTTRVANNVTVQRKQFVFGTVASDHVQLQKPAAVFYETGDFVLSGVLLHNGGPNGDLRGNAVTIHVRGLAGTNNGAALWTTSRTLWLPRNVATPISVSQRSVDPLIKYFSETARIEIHLEYRKSR